MLPRTHRHFHPKTKTILFLKNGLHQNEACLVVKTVFYFLMKGPLLLLLSRGGLILRL